MKSSRVNFVWKHLDFKLQENFILTWYTTFVCTCVKIVRTVKIGKIEALHIHILNYSITFIIAMKKTLTWYWNIWTFFKMESIAQPKINQNVFICDKCKKEFKRKSSLTRHVHTKHEPIDVPFCNMKLKNKHLLL